ncbi:MAG: hypothetical protein A2172_00200 [Candidatus Woykebacteria bacterium RBG_13_40_15]|uniref:DUF3987 domain-containing protein n=1 Tax=Candidatus Woykebacteria bacterium RBG_13_40_15 TaxID=1802593 RepID=A0A1G1WAC8_9BACT|nr:MAG: hypothetical protein A2172_00200 [Candidatus Woykebacteria bacterium RBG_13_40_15]
MSTNKEKGVFGPLTTEDLAGILSLTIKEDKENKIATFLCLLSVYTDDSQFNLSFIAPSSTGKSYIPIEISTLFPEEDVMMIGYTSPTAFFHDVGKLDKERGGYIVDLERKILVFLDQPHTQLIQHLRPILSHDKKEIQVKITDKSQKGSLRTKNVFIIGYPSVVFCTASLKIDEQDSTRFMLLSPEISQEKIQQGIVEKIKKESNKELYLDELENNPERSMLKQRIEAIKSEQTSSIKIHDPEKIQHIFFEKHKRLKPRHQRDIGRLICIIKSFALLNLWFRKREGQVIFTDDTDFEEALTIWDKISESQEFNLPPYIFNFFKEIIVPAYKEKNENSSNQVLGINLKVGLTKADILQKHYKETGRFLEDWRLRQEILPMLEASGLLTSENDPEDKRQKLYYPTESLTISNEEENSEKDGGVTEDSEELDLEDIPF